MSCVLPRPIGWISTRGIDGIDNPAPYSQFTNVSFDPPTVMFSTDLPPDGGRKDGVVNAEETGVFIWNMATYALRHAVNLTASQFAPEIDEFERAGLEKSEGDQVAVSRVAASPIQFECHHLKTVSLSGNGTMGGVDVVFGRVVMVDITDEALTADGRIDVMRLRPLARMAPFDYTTVDSHFEIIPEDNRISIGLESVAEGL